MAWLLAPVGAEIVHRSLMSGTRVGDSVGRPRALQLDDADNVAVALVELAPGERLELVGRSVVVRERIRAGHKVALERVEVGGELIKYGEVVGIATSRIGAGAHAHVHNVVSARLSGA